MPELPEVETMCRGIRPVIGRQVILAERPACRRRPIAIRPRIDLLRHRVEGKTIVDIQRAGKRVVIWLGKKSPEEAIVIEPRMTGLVLLSDPPTQDHLRFRLRFKSANSRRAPKSSRVEELLFWDRRGLGVVTLLSADEFAAKFSAENSSLGPDALRVTVDQLHDRLHRSRRAVKVALLDQRAIAGIGNLYASEILNVASVHPAARCNRLRGQQWNRIHAATLLILEEAIQHEGSTLSDGTYRNALNEAGGYQNHHRVYDRAGETCPTCGRGHIQRIVQAQRSTFFCPNCQHR